ncbi:response regulator transcription factor [Curtobacterium flaccumfaciens]|nr:response regulator transcription factor [Curtobacterium flaccumfaciens]
MTIRVLVVDDQAIVRDGLVTVLSLVPDLEVVGEASDGAEAVAAVERDAPDVVLMDLRMPVVDGPTATARITGAHPQVAVLVLTTYADDESIVTALRAGAGGT